MLAAAALIRAAEDRGLPAALLEIGDEPALRDAFGIPDDHACCCLIALGHPVEPWSPAGRLPLEEVCHAEYFGAPLALSDRAAVPSEDPRAPGHDSDPSLADRLGRD
jgi:hypothetical protein